MVLMVGAMAGWFDTMDEDTFEYIYDVSDKVTWYVQAILHGIYEHSNGR